MLVTILYFFGYVVLTTANVLWVLGAVPLFVGWLTDSFIYSISQFINSDDLLGSNQVTCEVLKDWRYDNEAYSLALKGLHSLRE